MLLYSFILMLPSVVIGFIARFKGSGLVRISAGILIGMLSAFSSFFFIRSFGAFFSSSFVFFAVPLVEELFKFVGVFVFARRDEEYSRSSCFLIPSGFAMFENTLFVSPDNFGLLVFRSFTALPVHLVASSFYISALHRPDEDDKRLYRLAVSFAASYVVHLAYNFAVRFFS